MIPTRERILFGTELRQRRTRAGLSLTDLAGLVHYSKSHLSKVETGGKPPSADLARRCDAALGCDGALSALVDRPAPTGRGPGGLDPDRPATADASATLDQDADEVWLLSLGTDGNDRFGVLSRRELLAGGMAGMAVWAGLAGPAAAPDASTVLGPFRSMFDQLRGLGQHLSADALLPMLVAQTHALRRLGAGAGTDDNRGAALRLAARFAEYTGWMAQEGGDDDRTLWWTDRAVRLAAAGGDREMAAYALVRRALVTLYRHDPVQTVALAGQAQTATGHPRIRGLAAQREAQGHALAGDGDECRRALDRAATLLAGAAAGSDAGEPVIGTSHAGDPVSLARGWCLFDLGQPAEAAVVLERELARLPQPALRTRARFGARLALAQATSGEAERACATLAPVLDAFERIGSATIRLDLRALARTLNRWHSHAPLQETRLRLNHALSLSA